MTVSQVKNALSGIISELSKTPWLFLRNPTKDFTRKRKLQFQDVVSLLLSMEAKSTTNKLLDYFKCDANMPTPSALRQRRDKILPEAFEFVFREFFARLTMYNFAERITTCVVIRCGSKKHAYQANFSAAIHICRDFLRRNVHPPDVEALLARFISPVRPDRKRARKLTPKGFVSFLYRVA